MLASRERFVVKLPQARVAELLQAGVGASFDMGQGHMMREWVVCLLALMEIQASRLGARVDARGEPILLDGQDRRRWDHLLIRRGLDALARAEALPGPLGPYALQAAIAACHARATSTDVTDWTRIAALYDALAQLAPSPVIMLNRAVAVAMAFGAAAGLELVDGLLDKPGLAQYHLLPAVRGDLLCRLGRTGEARAEFERAAALAHNERERALLRARARDVGKTRDGSRCEAAVGAPVGPSDASSASRPNSSAVGSDGTPSTQRSSGSSPLEKRTS